MAAHHKIPSSAPHTPSRNGGATVRACGAAAPLSRSPCEPPAAPVHAASDSSESCRPMTTADAQSSPGLTSEDEDRHCENDWSDFIRYNPRARHPRRIDLKLVAPVPYDS